MQKTKIMLGGLVKEREFAVDDRILESVEEHVYSGHILTGDPTHEKELH